MNNSTPPAQKRALQRLPEVAATLILLITLARVAYFYHLPDQTLVGIIPDDAFYYIQLAHHRVMDGLWSFDGKTPATGFHLLYGYAVALIFSFNPNLDWRELYIIVSIASSLAICFASYCTAKTAQNLFSHESSLLAVAPFLLTTCTIQSTSMMESWMVMLFSALTILSATSNKTPTRLTYSALILLGVAGSFSRSDYGLLPGVLFAVSILMRKSISTGIIKRNLSILIGAIAGVMVITAHNFYTSGSLFQASAQTKLYWSQISGHKIYPALSLAATVFLQGFETYTKSLKIAAFLAIGLLLVAVTFKATRRAQGNQGAIGKMLAVACAATIVGYILFYRHNSEAIQIWYAANLIAPAGIIIAAAAHFFQRKSHPFAAWPVFALYAAAGISGLTLIPWPHQTAMMQAGLNIRDSQENHIYGSWNAGIISYFSGKDILNIDGLTNDDVFPYIKSNTLYDYLAHENITRLVDFEAMLTLKSRRIRGGYDDPRIDQCISPLGAINPDAPKWRDSSVMIFAIKPHCP